MPGQTTSSRRRSPLNEALEGNSTSVEQQEKDVPQSGGWGAVAKRKARQEAEQEASKSIYDFFMGDGDTVQIQFLSKEPYCSDFFRVQIGKKYKYLNTQLATQKHCLMTQAGLTSTWRAAFKVLDFRGKWDKDKKCTEADLGKAYDEVVPQEKLWLVSNTVALALKSFIDRKGGDLTKAVIEVTRTGSDKTTSYSFDIARDEDDRKLEPIDYKEQFPSAEVCCTPPTDEMLVDWGVVTDSSSEGGRVRF